MASKYTHDLVATTGEYTNKAGEKKKSYVTVGKGFTDDQGRISMKLVSIPVGPEWSGWLSLYPAAKERDEQREPQGARSSEYGQREAPIEGLAAKHGREAPRNSGPGMPPAPAETAGDDFEDSIPF